jgi:hypothetical protein
MVKLHMLHIKLFIKEQELYAYSVACNDFMMSDKKACEQHKGNTLTVLVIR